MAWLERFSDECSLFAYDVDANELYELQPNAIHTKIDHMIFFSVDFATEFTA